MPPPEAGGDAGAALGAPPPEGGAAPVTVPADLLPGAKPGDTFTVKSVDGGNVTLEHQPGAGGGDEGGDWGEGLTQAAPHTEEGM